MTKEEGIIKEIERLKELEIKHLKDKNEFGYNACKEQRGKVEAELRGYKLAQKEILEKIKKMDIKVWTKSDDWVLLKQFWDIMVLNIEKLTSCSQNKKFPNNLQEKQGLESTKLNDIKDRKDEI